MTMSDPPNIDQRGFSNVSWEGKDPGTEIQFFPKNVDPDYLKTFGCRMAEGRFFSYEFPSDMRESLVLNETAVRTMGLDAPVGKRVTIGNSTYNIIGIIKDFHQTTLRKPIEPMVLRWGQGNFTICFRFNPSKKQEVISFVGNGMKGWDRFDPDRPFRYHMVDESIDNFYTSEKKTEVILAVFTIIALFTACLGLLGLASFMAEKRTREIGLRKIFGAPVKEMLWLQTREFSKWIILSGIISGPLAYWAAKAWLNNFAYHFNPGIGILLVTVFVTLVIAQVIVSYQSVRAAIANPVDSLRHEY